jgi:hypothetical protein
MATASNEPVCEIFRPSRLKDRISALQLSVENGTGIMVNNGSACSSACSSRGQSPQPFSDQWESSSKMQTKRGDPEYGCPVKGSKTEARGLKAAAHLNQEMKELCSIIRQYGAECHDGYVILFGDLFQIYTCISDKVVGLLLRGRKHKMLTFEGEILFQRRDDMVPITLFKPPKVTITEQ